MYDARMTGTARTPKTLATTSAGSGDDVIVLIHGFPLTSEMWRAQIDGLASPALRVVAPDLPGCGRTPGAISSIEDAADNIAALVTEIGATRVVLGGFSMGGYIALAFARRHAPMLHGLILIDTKAEADSDEAKKGRYALAERARSEGKGIVIEGMLPRLLGETTRAVRPEIVVRTREISSACTLDGIAGALHAMAERQSSVEDLPSITVPALVIVGHDDVITPVADAEAMAAAVPGAKLVVIPDSGHLTPMEQPRAVNDAIRSWLASLS
jgi:pimeloyl-ACP methyl ester carboxylesterase